MTMKTPKGTRAVASLLGALFLAAATGGLAGCNKRENPPTATTPPAPTSPASESMPATPAASAASQ